MKLVSHFEYWDLNRDAGSSSLNVTLHWDSQSGTINTMSDMRVSHYNSGTTEWENMGNTATSGGNADGTVTSSTVSSFSPFTLGSTTSNNALPVDFVFVDAHHISNKTVNVIWQTGSEINNSGFEVEKLVNADFVTIGFKDGATNSSEVLDYSLLDHDAKKGKNTYRIKQIDLDGNLNYSKVVTVDVNQNTDVVLYPNPANSILNINLDDEFEYTISSTLGKLIRTGVAQQQIDISALSTGLYFININADGTYIQLAFSKE